MLLRFESQGNSTEDEAMKNESKKPSIVIIIAALFLLILVVGGVAVLRSITVSGSATLQDGSQVAISSTGLGFSVSSKNSGSTEINAGGYVVRFLDRQVNVNGVNVGLLSDEAKDYQLVINRGGLKLTSDDGVVAAVD